MDSNFTSFQSHARRIDVPATGINLSSRDISCDGHEGFVPFGGFGLSNSQYYNNISPSIRGNSSLINYKSVYVKKNIKIVEENKGNGLSIIKEEYFEYLKYHCDDEKCSIKDCKHEEKKCEIVKCIVCDYDDTMYATLIKYSGRSEFINNTDFNNLIKYIKLTEFITFDFTIEKLPIFHSNEFNIYKIIPDIQKIIIEYANPLIQILKFCISTEFYINKVFPIPCGGQYIERKHLWLNCYFIKIGLCFPYLINNAVIIMQSGLDQFKFIRDQSYNVTRCRRDENIIPKYTFDIFDGIGNHYLNGLFDRIEYQYLSDLSISVCGTGLSYKHNITSISKEKYIPSLKNKRINTPPKFKPSKNFNKPVRRNQGFRRNC